MDQDFNPADPAGLLRLVLLALLLALVPLGLWWLRKRDQRLPVRLAALTTLTLFLTFDLIVFGAFTRLTDSGLGCPDWPGCYGHASPVGAHAFIREAEALMPTGPVTQAKAWIEMLHRYLAMVVGALILVMAAVSWRARRELPHSAWWATATLVWVIIQGLFGKYTVVWKLYPAIVTAHLLGAQVLLALLVIQHASFQQRPMALPVSRALIGAALALLLVQIALGGWVSTNYAVLACQGFPSCNGQWWPPMDFAHGFTLRRELGEAANGDGLPFDALVAIHWVHRLMALVVTAALLLLAVRLWRAGGAAARFGLGLSLLVVAQVATGVSNVVLGWPIAAALLHSGGAAAMVGLLVALWARHAGAARWSRVRTGAGLRPAENTPRQPAIDRPLTPPAAIRRGLSP